MSRGILVIALVIVIVIVIAIVMTGVQAIRELFSVSWDSALSFRSPRSNRLQTKICSEALIAPVFGLARDGPIGVEEGRLSRGSADQGIFDTGCRRHARPQPLIAHPPMPNSSFSPTAAPKIPHVAGE